MVEADEERLDAGPLQRNEGYKEGGSSPHVADGFEFLVDSGNSDPEHQATDNAEDDPTCHSSKRAS